MPKKVYNPPRRRDLYWVGTSLQDLREFPAGVKEQMGHALHLAQMGDKSPDAKPLAGFGGAGVLEIVEDFDGDTYRAVYTVKLATGVYVLHAFQKKSHHGSRTDRRDVEMVKSRLKDAESADRAKRSTGS